MNIKEKTKRRLKIKFRHELRRKERRRIEKLKYRLFNLFGITLLDKKHQIIRKAMLAKPDSIPRVNIFRRIKDKIIGFLKEKFIKRKQQTKNNERSKFNIKDPKIFTPGKKVFKDYKTQKK